jgi:hypothetical protein
VQSNHPGPDRHDRGPRSLLEPGDHAVDVPIVCSITRFRLRRARHLLPAYREYQKVVHEARLAQTPGLLRAAFLVENPVTWYSLSIWSDRNAIAHFGTNVPRHVDAARTFFPRLVFQPAPELWSTKWRLDSVSNNLNWGDFDMRGAILDAAE